MGKPPGSTTAELAVSSADIPAAIGVSASGYYDWLHRAPSKRTLANAVLTESIRQVHKASDETYGMPRIRFELRDNGQQVSRKRVARLMRKACIRGVSRRRSFTVTTERDRRQRPAPDLVNRQFRALGPDQLWVADMTYIPTWAGFLYLALVIDAFSRKVVGWSMGERMTAYVFAPCDGYFERCFELGDPVVAGQLAGRMHQLARPELAPEEVFFQSTGTLYAHGLLGHVRAGQNLAVVTEDVPAPVV